MALLCFNLRNSLTVGVKVLRDCGVQIAEVDTCSNPQGKLYKIYFFAILDHWKKLRVNTDEESKVQVIKLHSHVRVILYGYISVLFWVCYNDLWQRCYYFEFVIKV